MKKLFIMAGLAGMLASCGNDASKEEGAATDKKEAAAPVKIEYPYTLDEPYANWQPGDQQHVVTVMKALKGFETGDIAACVAGFGDSVELRFDQFRAKLSNDSLRTFFANERGKYTDMKIKMGDWESVISEDKKQEYVTLWYMQSWTDKAGKTDSVSVINDCKIVNGKITMLDEKMQRFPPAK